MSINPISHTAYYCCGVRMVDADSKSPLLNDVYARRFMDEEGQRVFAELRASKRADVSCTVRSRMIEDHLRKAIDEDQSQPIILIGAGFDSKAYRLPGGHFFEIDEAHIIERKNRCLPVSECPNPLVRRSSDFSSSHLLEIFSAVDGKKPPIFVIEGVFMYLTEEQITTLLDCLNQRFPKHKLFCDLMTLGFINKHMQQYLANIARYQCSFKFGRDNPEQLFMAKKYRMLAKESIVGRSASLGGIAAPSFILKLFSPTLINGYSICSFETMSA